MTLDEGGDEVAGAYADYAMDIDDNRFVRRSRVDEDDDDV